MENKMDEKKIQAMREGGKILAELLTDLRGYVQAGMSEKEIDKWVRDEVVRRGAEVAYDFLPEKFPGAICISTNEQLVHGAPSDYVLEEGDKVSFDMVIRYEGYYTDAAFTMIVPAVAGGKAKGSPAVKEMIAVTKNALEAGVNEVRPGATLGDIGYAVEQVLRRGHLGVVENYVGHFIGREMHEEPAVPNYGKRGRGYVLQAGDTLCIEPMSSLGSPKNRIMEDGSGWTVVLKDGSCACHCEYTILVTEDGHEILTPWK
ncbi:type I methionyl aminopeptidase [Candidatus Saccharibacteria bacterium]|nr:type I methionyl aminopeptidase [Candidatus Saccharibacteria bacterium]